VDTHGLQNTTGPYYSPCILPAVFALACLGMQRVGVFGRALAIAWCLVAAWIASLTYVAKLVPYYGGLIGRSNLSTLWHWWADPRGRLTLSVTTLAPVGVVYALLACFLLILILVTVRIVLDLKAEPSPQSGKSVF
jgi:hypothetical protein